MAIQSDPVDDAFLDDLHGDFLDESGQLLDRLNENLLYLDQWVRARHGQPPERCNDDLMNDMFRAAHSIKGLSAMLGLQDINCLTHKIENVFDAARTGQLYFCPASVELLFQSLDALSHHIDRVRHPHEDRMDDSAIVDKIQEFLHILGAVREVSSQGYAEASLEAALQQLELLDEPQPKTAAAPSGNGHSGQNGKAQPAAQSASHPAPFADGVEDEL